MLEYPLWKRLCVVVTILVGLAFAAPNLFSEQARQSIPSWLPSAGVNLGLDLRGGAHVLLESQVEEVFEKRISDLRQQVRRALLDADVRRFSRLSRGADFVSVTVTNAEDMETARAALAALSEPVGMGLASGLGFETGARTFDIAVDGQTITLTMTEEERAQIVDRTISQSLEVIRRRIDESGTRDPTIQRQGTDRVLVQVPGVGSAEEVLSLIGRTASLTFHDVVLDGDPDRPRPGTIAAPYPEFGQVLVLRENPVLSGERLVDAQLGFDPDSGAPVVNFRFDATGGGIFSDYTRSNIGRPFAIVLDGEVISAPNIQSAITGGAGFIEGGFTVETARDLAVLLRSGALPASLVPLEQRTVGPDLGADSIAAGEAAAVLAFLAVLIFMSIVYRAFGIFANIALMLNVGLILGALSAIGATLTLPGIAGIVLTIGMAVDANVLVFERIREELKRAKKPHQAVDRGYSEALSAIIDANITTLIAAVILFVLG
ncbi:MAG: protein translocase subunit SecD, partial [Pseudomonadota bacterium]